MEIGVRFPVGPQFTIILSSFGGLAEWFKAPLSKSGWGKPLTGSNPVSSAMNNSRKVLIVSESSSDAFAFEEILRKKGLSVTRIKDNINDAIEQSHKIKPGLIIFITPVLWTTVRDFLEKMRPIEEFKATPIVYLTSVIDGVDQVFLHRYGVYTFTFGPVPNEEIARYLMKLVR